MKVLLNITSVSTFFTKSVVPDGVVDAITINCYEGFGQIWDKTSFLYDWEAEFAGIRNIFMCELKFFHIYIEF